MATKMFNEGLKRLARIDWEAATVKALLCMTNTTVDTEDDAVDDITDFTTLDEADGASYVRQTLAGKTTTKQDATDNVKLSCDDITFTTLGDGTRDIAGVLIVLDDAGTLRPLSWHEFGVARVADGSNFLVEIRSDTGLYTISKG